MKRKNNLSTYAIETKKARYCVTLEHLKNTNYGCPRFKANIIVLQHKEDGDIEKHFNRGCFYTATYTFKGSYCGDFGECEKVVKVFEEEQAQ